jgi:DNA-binding MarR family transcriptional regulator
MAYHKWTSNEERVIQHYYSGGRYKGIIHDIAKILQITRQKVANHIKEMRKHKRL